MLGTSDCETLMKAFDNKTATSETKRQNPNWIEVGTND